jgi:hypothetical protein
MSNSYSQIKTPLPRTSTFADPKTYAVGLLPAWQCEMGTFTAGLTFTVLMVVKPSTQYCFVQVQAF